MKHQCKNCGGAREIHAYNTFACPVGGVEAMSGNTQEWTNRTYEELPEKSSLNEITLLDFFAAFALCGLISSEAHRNATNRINEDSITAYSIADAMLKAREENCL